MEQVEQSLENAIFGDEPKIHLACCINDKLSMCNKELLGVSPENNYSSCTDCIEADETSPPITCYASGKCVVSGKALF